MKRKSYRKLVTFEDVGSSAVAYIEELAVEAWGTGAAIDTALLDFARGADEDGIYFTPSLTVNGVERLPHHKSAASHLGALLFEIAEYVANAAEEKQDEEEHPAHLARFDLEDIGGGQYIVTSPRRPGHSRWLSEDDALEIFGGDIGEGTAMLTDEYLSILEKDD